MTSHFEDQISAEDPLPEHWEMRVDQRTGLPYFLNHWDHFTTWDDPRVVGQPRGMMNNLGLLRRSMSPQPDTSRMRMTSEEPQTMPFDNFLSAPSQPSYTQSLPRRRNQQRSFAQNPFPADDWFRTGFDEPDSDLFDDPQWPIKAHTLQRHFPRSRDGSPLASYQQKTGGSPRHSPARNSPQRFQSNPFTHRVGDIRMIPIRAESLERDNPDREGIATEHYITPTQYKQKVNPVWTQEEITSDTDEPRIAIVIRADGNDHMSKGSDSPKPKQSRTEPTTHDQQDRRKMSVDDSDADAVMRRMNSVYDNHDPAVGSDEDDVSDGTNANPETQQFSRNDDDHSPVDKTSSCERTHERSLSPKPNKGEMEQNIPNTTLPESERQVEPEQDPESNTADEENNNQLLIASIQAIKKINTEVEGYKQELDEYCGAKNGKEYRYLDEMLTRCQLSLDNVLTHGDIEIRKLRKQTVNYIESLLQTLEAKSVK